MRILGFSALAVASPAPAQEIAAAAADAAVATAMEDPLAIGEADLRMTVPVSIGDKGVWPFVIDTGAERTVVSAELAERLALTAGPVRRIVTMAGVSPAATALVPLLRVGKLASQPIEAPVFARANMGAIGMLGIDALQGHKVRIDFDRDSMTMIPSRKRSRPRPGRDEIVITAKSLYGQLIVTDARLRGRKVAVVVDTGAPMSIANTALLRRAGNTKPLGPMQVMAVSGQTFHADVHQLARLEIGGVAFMGVPVAVADATPFRRFGLEDEPALLLGMDTLRLFRAVEIDFANRTIRLTLPRKALSAGPALAGL